MNRYRELTNKQAKEMNDFPMMFAFNSTQFEEGMEKLNVTDKDEICSTGGGGYIKKTDAMELQEMAVRHSKEIAAAIAKDKTGTKFIYDMFFWELQNHEYSYTGEIEDTLYSLDLTVKEVYDNKILLSAMQNACRDINEYELD